MYLAKTSYTHKMNDLAQGLIWTSSIIFLMVLALRHVFAWMITALRTREDLVLENLALHQQLLAVVRKNSMQLPSDREAGTYLFGLPALEKPKKLARLAENTSQPD